LLSAVSSIRTRGTLVWPAFVHFKSVLEDFYCLTAVEEQCFCWVNVMSFLWQPCVYSFLWHPLLNCFL